MWVGLLTPCIVSRGGFLYRMIVSGESFAPFKSCPGGLSGGVMDEIDACITRNPFPTQNSKLD